MKTLFISIFTAASLYASAQTPFQGIITFKGENKTFSETSEIVWSVKEGSSRLDITSHTKEVPNAAYSLYFVKNQPNVQMVADAGTQKKVYDIPYSSFAKSEFSSAYTVEPTGNKATYAGYECEEYIVRTENTIVSCWVSKYTGINPSSFPSVILGKGVFAVLMRNNIQGIPLKITSKDFAGNVISDQEVVSIQTVQVPESTFVVPSLEKGN